MDYSKLRSVTVRKIERALLRDGFTLKRQKGVTRFYKHADGRRVLLHWHNPNQELRMGTLREVLGNEAQWSEDDLRRLGLLK